MGVRYPAGGAPLHPLVRDRDLETCMRRLATCIPLFLLLLASPGAADEGTDAEDLARVTALFNRMRAASADGDRKAMARLFHMEGVLGNIRATKALDPLPGPVRARVEARLLVGLAADFTQRDLIAPFVRLEIRSIQPGANASRRRVSVRHFGADGSTSRIIWHLQAVGEAYQITDFEDLGLDMRFSALLAAQVAGAQPGGETFLEGMRALLAASSLRQAGDTEAALAHLATLDELTLPAQLEALRLTIQGSLLGLQGAPEAGLAALKQARALRPDMPAAVLMECALLIELKRWAGAIPRAEHYLRLVGPEAQAYVLLGRAHLGRGARKEGQAAFETALHEAPDLLEAIVGYARALPPGQQAPAIARFLALPERTAAFDTLAGLLLDDEAFQVLGLFIDAFAKVEPAHRDVPYYRGEILYAQKQFGAAATEFKRAMDAVTDAEVLAQYAGAWCDVMLELGKPLQALAACTDKAWALPYLAWDLSGDGHAATLTRLATQAAKALGADHAGIRFFTEEARFMQAQYEQALPGLRTLRATLSLKGEALTDAERDYLWEGEDRLLRCHVRLKQMDAASQLAVAIATRDDDPRYVLIVRANEGKTVEALAALRTCLVEANYDPAHLFEDEDLREILKGAPYAELRGQFYGK